MSSLLRRTTPSIGREVASTRHADKGEKPVKMTAEQLMEHVKSAILPTLRDQLGDDIKVIVAESVQAALESGANSPAAGAALVAGASEAETNSAAITAAEQAGADGEGVVNFGTYVRCLMKAKGNYDAMPVVARKMGRTKMAAAVEKALAASDAVDGGFLVPEDVSADVIEILRPMSFMRDLVGPNVIPMPTGTFKIPRQTAGVNGDYIGENKPAGKEQPKFGQLTLSYKKLAVVVPVSNDLVRFDTPAGDALIRRDIARGLGTRENRAFLRDNGQGGTPRGLKHWIVAAGKVASNTTINLDNITSDLGKLLLSLVEKDVPLTRPGWIMSPRTWNHLMTIRTTNGPYAFRDELKGGTLLGFPFKMSTQVLITLTVGANADCSEIYLADFDDVVIGESLGLRIDASDTAAYDDGGTVVSAFSNDQMVIRAIAEHDFALRRTESASLLTGVRWGA